MIKLGLTRNYSRPVTLKQMDACNLEFQDGTVDIVISNMVLMLVEQPELMIKESFRVLKSNSMAAFSVWGRQE